MASKLTLLTQQKTAAQLQSMSRQSYDWLLKKIAEMRTTSAIPAGVNREQYRNLTGLPVLGGMYCYYYDPKLKDTLPYYDKFPLVLVLERYPDGFLGLNLHYLPITYRIAFLSKLMDYATYTPDNEIKRIRVTYDILTATRRLREFKPCLKRYLYSHIKSKILTIQPNEWDVASMLPMHQFKGERADVIWKESVEEIRNS